MILASFLVLVAGVYRLGKIAATPLVGAIAAALLLTRFDYPFLAARGYIDIPYMALVVWAAILEWQPPAARDLGARPALAGGDAAARGVVPGGDVLGAGWRGRRPGASASSTPRWPRAARWCGARSTTWSRATRCSRCNYTSASAEDLGRQRPLSELPAAIPRFFENLVKLPVFLAAGVGAVLGVVISPRRMLMPFVLLGAGLATFIAIGVAGASVIERYLAVPALALMVLAAVAVGGWTMLLPGKLRTVWMVGAVLIVVLGVGYTATRLNFSRFDNELRFRGQAHNDLTEVLNDPKVKAGLRCGPLTGPNHKIVPDARWIAGLGDGSVLAREWIGRIERQQADAAAGRGAQGQEGPAALGRGPRARAQRRHRRGDRRHQPLRDLQARLVGPATTIR